MKEVKIRKILIKANEIILGKVDITVIAQYDNGDVEVERKLYMGDGDTLEIDIEKKISKPKRGINFIANR